VIISRYADEANVFIQRKVTVQSDTENLVIDSRWLYILWLAR